MIGNQNISAIGLELFDYFVSSEEISDMHIKENTPPFFRRNGRLKSKPIECSSKQELDHELASDVIRDIYKLRYGDELGSVKFNEFVSGGYQEDFAIQINEKIRARVNIYKSLGKLSAAVRQIPSKIPQLENIGFIEPVHLDKIRSISSKKEGLILVTGQTGSGKSTTLAAIVDYINAMEDKHIITIEDPVEFRHINKKSIISHREVGEGNDTLTFFDGLRASLREDPDIILIGEIRDKETALAAMQAAQTGHIVLATLHTNSASETVTRLIDMFPADQSKLIRTSIAGSLLMILSQKLPQTPEGKRIFAYELMFNTTKIKQIISAAEGNVAQQVKNAIFEGRVIDHSISMETCLGLLVKSGKISEDMGRSFVSGDQQAMAMFDLGCGKKVVF